MRVIEFGRLVLAPSLVAASFIDADDVAAYHLGEARDHRWGKCVAKRVAVSNEVARWNVATYPTPITAAEVNVLVDGRWWRIYTALQDGYHRAEYAFANGVDVWIAIYQIRVQSPGQFPPDRSGRALEAASKVSLPLRASR